MNEVEITVVDENDGSTSAPITQVVEEQVLNGELVPDSTNENLTVNSRNQ